MAGPAATTQDMESRSPAPASGPGSIGAADQGTDRRFPGIRFIHVDQPSIIGVSRLDDSVFLRDIEEHRADQIARTVEDPPVGIAVLVPVEDDDPVHTVLPQVDVLGSGSRYPVCVLPAHKANGMTR